MSPLKSMKCLSCQSNGDQIFAELSPKESEYLELLERTRANAIPETHHERSQMKLLIDEAEDELERCDQAISELEEQLARLKKCRLDVIRKRIAPRRSLISPIRKLPPEVLICVFAHVDRTITLQSPNFKLRSPVFGLTWVCAHWRMVALSTSHLWSAFYFDLYDLPHDLFGLFDSTRECFDVRARNSLIDLSLDHYLAKTSNSDLIPLYDVVCQSAERWRDVKLDFTGNGSAVDLLIEKMLASGQNRFAHLESLAVLVTVPFKSYEVLRLFQNCPRLRDLRSIFLDPTEGCIDMRNLTSLDIQRCEGHNLTKLLMHCPLLETLGLGLFSEAQVPDEVCYHTRLSKFEVLLADQELKQGWSTGLHLPALTRLSLSEYSYDNHVTREMVELLLRSHCFLQSIILRTSRQPEEWNEPVMKQILADVSSISAPNALEYS
ncbi:hypothetical protein D9757_010909 [Collybiopsis confluens]|uniref:F-box domain-containing protein n=1 Tax=Collybiopsis confluens TaxID=2823264 RepID=A0A8H5GIY1_9AGAR|nr:hypothetical protein D9757_010909 [Collybiopsis confluens]